MHEYYVLKTNDDRMWVYADRYEERGGLTVFIMDDVDRVQVDTSTIVSITQTY